MWLNCVFLDIYRVERGEYRHTTPPLVKSSVEAELVGREAISSYYKY